MDWHEKAEDELCEQLNSGEITERDFNAGMRELRDEYQQGEQDAVEQARENYHNNY